ncbi:MAG: hypothetical protein K2X77_13485 [Candidatus Obscuribacterales bacterium]|jgi:indole-3-glycerol phosphate synthase/phosphoribosylanthranilate isomerase|nr:hypothetical protein [Candidatus Obscuribacterales bacterium]
MADFLDNVLQHKLVEIAERKAANPLESFRDKVEKSEGRFLKALSNSGLNIVAEIKPRSPALGKMEGSISVDERIAIYSKHAKAISVLCDQKFFDGSIDLLRNVSQASSLPTLCKDFIIDPYQVYEARMAGADAVLLICKLLSIELLQELFHLICQLGMTAVVEVQNITEMESAIALGAEVILINNRDLQSLQIDLNTTKNLAKLAPQGTVVIAASGVENAQDLASLRDHASNFLIGSAFMKSPDPQAKFLEFFQAERAFRLGQFVDEGSFLSEERRNAESLVKVCGICNIHDAEFAATSGADFLGFIFAESPRKLDAGEAASIISGIRSSCDKAPKLVGVFRNQPIEEVLQTSRRLELDAIQLHGSESPDYVLELRESLLGNGKSAQNPPIIKVIEIDPADSQVFNIDPAIYAGLVDLFLFDRPKAHASNVSWLDNVLKTVGDKLCLWRPFLFAGGINEGNFAKALTLKPVGVDLASGVESSPRQKDHSKIKNFFDKIKGAVKC